MAPNEEKKLPRFVNTILGPVEMLNTVGQNCHRAQSRSPFFFKNKTLQKMSLTCWKNSYLCGILPRPGPTLACKSFFLSRPVEKRLPRPTLNFMMIACSKNFNDNGRWSWGCKGYSYSPVILIQILMTATTVEGFGCLASTTEYLAVTVLSVSLKKTSLRMFWRYWKGMELIFIWWRIIDKIQTH